MRSLAFIQQICVRTCYELGCSKWWGNCNDTTDRHLISIDLTFWLQCYFCFIYLVCFIKGFSLWAVCSVNVGTISSLILRNEHSSWSGNFCWMNEQKYVEIGGLCWWYQEQEEFSCQEWHVTEGSRVYESQSLFVARFYCYITHWMVLGKSISRFIGVLFLFIFSVKAFE